MKRLRAIHRPNIIFSTIRVDDAPSRRIRRSQRMVRVADAGVKLNLLSVQTVHIIRPGHPSPQRRVDRQVEQDLEIWLEPMRRQLLRQAYIPFRQSSRTPLVCKRGIAEPVRDHDEPLSQSGSNHFADMLSARGREEQHFRCRQASTTMLAREELRESARRSPFRLALE